MRQMSLTPELVALCHRDQIDPGPSGEWTQLSDDDFSAIATRLAGEADAGRFGCSLADLETAFESVEQRRASAHGWHRSFCLDLVRWRGSAAQPGLMMALERGGRCDGVIYRLPDGDEAAQIEGCCDAGSTITKPLPRSGGFRCARRKAGCKRWASGLA